MPAAALPDRAHMTQIDKNEIEKLQSNRMKRCVTRVEAPSGVRGRAENANLGLAGKQTGNHQHN
jgi:hypothetical protein